ncbi:MAG: efflux transporter outer membrane subunit [Rhodospirillaceae bacterium]|nr:efflux transporter outer membrane subunit [Rhodospirillaceae bacterium]
MFIAPARMVLFATAAALGLAGCAGPSIDRPDEAVPVPSTWNQPVTAATATQYPDAAWWAVYDSAELNRLVDLAEASNPDLSAAAYRIAQASAQARSARAALYPSLSGSASASRSMGVQGTPSNSLSLGLEASYELDIWGENRANVDAAVAARVASEYDREAVALSLVAEVATTYFQYLSLSDRIATAEEVLGLSQQVLALVRAQAQVGTVSDLDVAQQEVTVAGLEAAIPSLQLQRDQTLNALAALLGTTAGSLALTGTTLDGVALPTVTAGLPSEVLERRPDLRSAEAEIRAASASLEAAHAAMYPNIQLTGSTGLASSALQSLFEPAGFLSTLAAGLSQPLFDAGRLEAEQDTAAAAEAIAIESYRAAVLAAFQDVEDALAAIRYTGQLAEIEARAVAQARRAYGLAVAQYQAGATDLSTLLDAQRDLAGQLDEQRQTRFDQLAATVDLFNSLGGGW